MLKSKKSIVKKAVRSAEKSNVRETKAHEKSESAEFEAGEAEEEKEMSSPMNKFKNLGKK